MQVDNGLDSKKRFEALLDGLKDAYKELLDLGLKISTVITAVLGWFATRDNPLPFLCGGLVPVATALCLVVFGFGLICFLFTTIGARARRAYKRLIDHGFEEALYERFCVTHPMVAGGIASQALLMGGVFTFIVHAYLLGGAKCIP